MKLKAPQIQKLARLIYEKLAQKNQIKILSSEKKVLDKIASILTADAQLEDEIEALARKTMDKLSSKVESGEIDYHKMYTMVKKQIMKEKKFVP